MIGFHLQRPVDGWTRTLNRMPAGCWIKAVDNVQALDEAKRINPGLKTVLRHWYDGGQIFDTTDQGILRQRARTFFDTFIDGTFKQYAHNVDAIEEFNEYNATSHTGEELARRVAWADAVSWVWKNEYRTVPKLAHIRLVLGSVAIGNDLPWQYAKFAYERDAILGYHPYVPVRDKQVMAGEWQYYSGRFTVMDADFVARGYRCQWLFTEFGPVGYNPPASLNALDGWRHHTVCNGDVNSYLQVIDYWLQRAAAWNASHGNRALGAVLFTTGGVEPWGDFETKQPEIDAVTAFMEAWGPVDPPDPPPPPPPPVTVRTYSRTAHLLPQNATEAQVVGVARLAYPKRQTVLFSADDGAINPDPEQAQLTAKALHVWGAWPGGSEQAFREWLTTYYAPLPALTFHAWAELPGAFVFTDWPTLYKTGGLLGGGINQLFGANPDTYGQYGLPGHEGIDLHSVMGDPIFAVADGVVHRVHTNGTATNYGVNVRLMHDGGYQSIYAHLSATDAIVGQTVRGGDVIGYAGNSGNSSGPHLHLTLRLAGANDAGLTQYPNDEVDPFPYMRHLLP